jgi:hypothetical protein
MGLNARMSPSDQRLYNPNRDVAHNFNQVIMEVAERCEKGTWDALVKLAEEKGISDEVLGKACQSLCKFVATQADEPKESMPAGLARCGFLDLPPAARIIVSAYIGTVILGMSWAGVREATLGGVGPTVTYQNLRWHGMRCARLMTMPRWKRSLYCLWGRVKRAWRVLTRKDLYE